MKHNAVALALTAAGLLSTGTALAQTSYSFSGFGTLGATHNDNRDADFIANRFQPNGPGRSSPTMFGVDTKAGVQASVQIGNDLSAVVQAVTDHRFDNSYAPRFEWANLKYQVSKDLYVRAGRVVAPVFLVSDSRNVGYAQTMVRMPVEVYGQNPITYLDGVDFGYRMNIADGTLSIVATSGVVKTTPQPGMGVRGHGSLLNFTYERGNSTFRIGGFKDKVDLHGDALGQMLLPFQYAALFGVTYSGPTPISAGLKNKLIDLGYAYDNGTWLGQAEYIQARFNAASLGSDAAYAMGGYRTGKFTPFVAYAKSITKTGTSVPQAVSPGGFIGDQIAYGINVINAQTTGTLANQHTISLGARYDVLKNVALKLQYDRIHKPGSTTTPNSGWIKMGTPSYPSLYADAAQKDISLNLLTVTVDFVF